jgi:SSS family solute:Na+ symporter
LFDISTLSVSLPFFLFISLIFGSIYFSRIREITADGFFFADHDSSWLVLGASFMTSWISGFFVFELIGPPQNNWLVIGYGVVSALMLAVLGGVVGPLFMKMRVNTLPEYFEKRFGRGTKFFLSALYVFCNITIKLLVVLVLGGALISKIAHVDAFSPLLFFLVVTGLCVVVGGLKTEMYTNVLEGFLIVAALAIFSFWISGQKDLSGSTIASVSSGIEASSKSFGGWLFFALPAVGFWFWGADQAILQRVLSAQSVHSLRKATLFQGVLQIIPVVLMAGVMAAYVPVMLTHGGIDRIVSTNAMPEMLRVGLLLALAAGLMALFSSIFNSTSSLITFDFFRTFKPSSSDRTLLFVGRITSIIAMLCGILLIPISQTLDMEFCLILVRMFAYFASLVAAVFGLSLVVKRIDSRSAFLTLCIVSCVILFRVVGEIIKYNQGLLIKIVNDVQSVDSIEFTTLIFLSSIVLLFVFQALESTFRPMPQV